MEQFLYLLFVVLCVAACRTSLIRHAHMLQLSSYQSPGYFKWLRERGAKQWAALFAVVLGAAVCLTDWLWLSILLNLFLLAAAFKQPKKAKKPLVYTSRLKRLLFTFFLLFALVIGVGFLVPAPYGYGVLCLWYGLISLIVPLVNWINEPVERSVRQYYINDAKKMLKAHPNLIIIGITGSYGKTSMKYYLATLLKAKYHVLMTPESYNTPMGVVRTIREHLNPTHQIFICEMGARHVGDIKELCDIVHPKHGIITSIGPQHLETFHNIQNIIDTKFELADALPEDGVLFVNGDNSYIAQHPTDKTTITYGTGCDNDVVASDVHVTRRGTIFSVAAGEDAIADLQTQLIGWHNVTNLAGAIAVSRYLGVPFDDLAMQLKKLLPVPHRLQMTERNGVVLIDDAYNSNPNGSKAALDALALFDGYRILVTPGMVELGDEQDNHNRIFGTQAAQVCHYVILVGEKQTAPILNGLLSAGYDTNNVFVADTVEEAIAKAYSIKTERKKIILLENDLPDNY